MAALILVVDDDPVQRRLLEGMVQKFGYDVVSTEGGDAADVSARAELTAGGTDLETAFFHLTREAV